MKKYLSLLVAMMMCLTVFCAAAAEGELPGYLYTGPEYDYDHLTVGNITAMTGSFTTRLFSYSTTDLDVNSLLNGYNLVEWKSEINNFDVDETVVSSLTVLDDASGNRSYVITLYDDLYFSDGTPITAWDYAFNILLSVAPQAKEIGGQTDLYPSILGMEAYKNGEKSSLEGLSVVNDHMMIITVGKAYRPYFHEMGLLMCEPLPIAVIAPGCSLKDDGNGVYIDGPFTAELLCETLLNAETGYVTHPSVVSGPYKLISFDGVTAELEINEYYKGNSKGEKPSIQYITYTLAEKDTMIEKLESGEFGLLNKVLDADLVVGGTALVGTGNYDLHAYPRIGQSYISFCCEKQDTVGSKAVRQAIAYCLDKDALTAGYTGNYGLRMDGYYGLGQWMYQIMTGAMSAPSADTDETVTPEEEAAWQELNYDGIKVYNLDIDEAVRLLEEDGWTLNETGEPFTAGKDAVRCKNIDGQIVALNLTMLYPEGNTISEHLDECFVSNLAEAGIRVELVPTEWNQLLRYYYRQDQRDCDMMYLASNFNLVFDPWPTFNTADADIGRTNYTGINSPDLMEAAQDMALTEPDDLLGYMVKWIHFQECYEEELPAIPVYGNVYFDFNTRCLHNYNINSTTNWANAVVGSYMGDAVDESVETYGETLEEQEIEDEELVEFFD